ncbi:MAG: SBBP repeat-containing protein [Planctomycetales bacterium]|nr:SBBP repeat-containing protein [Planctomycetales bacterium]
MTTTVSYFIGNDPEQWHPAVPVWGGVRYVDLYPGIDLELSAASVQLATRLNADLDAIALRVEGADALTLDGDVLRLSTAAGDVRLPLIQVTATPAAGAQVQPNGPQIFDVSAPFISRSSAPRMPAANPADLLYSTFLGGNSGYDYIRGIAVDEEGNAYVAGGTMSSDFPITSGAFDPTLDGTSDVFVAQLNADGSQLVYATFLGGSDSDSGSDISLDNEHNVFVTGGTLSNNFPVTLGAYDISYNGRDDVFVAKLGPTGGSLAYATYIGGADSEGGAAIASDGNGNAYVTGKTLSSDFPTTPGSYDSSFNGGNSDVFVVKLNPSASRLTYSTLLGGSRSEESYSVAVDSVANAFVTGMTYSTDFPTTADAFGPTYNGGSSDTFVVKLNYGGDALGYSTFLGGTRDEYGEAIAVDITGSAYVTGWTRSSNFPTTPDAFDTSFNGGTCGGSPCDDAYVVKVNSAGSGLSYATFIGGSSYDQGRGIAVDDAGSTYIVGNTVSPAFPTTVGAFDTSYNGYGDSFVLKLPPVGSDLAYATFLGGSQNDVGSAIAVNAVGTVYASGQTSSENFPTTPGSFDTTYYRPTAFLAGLDLYFPNVVAAIEQPLPGASISGVTDLRGFALDWSSATGPGTDAVRIYLDGPSGAGTLIGNATYGLPRPDVAAQYGAAFVLSGWELTWDTTGLPFGLHQLYVYAHRTTDDIWAEMPPHPVIVSGNHQLWLPISLRNR